MQNIAYCTLFNSVYLEKGLVTFKSLENVCKDYILYVLAMDDLTFKILQDINHKHLKPIRLKDFENRELLLAKANRSFGEYCWTCSSSLIYYVLKNYNPSYCAYIDADLFFYSNPNVLIAEMVKKNASTLIVGHRFYKHIDKELTFRVGKYCVEFNCFKNDKNGLNILNIWKNQCLNYCACDGDGIHWADQKYMDNWITDYDYAIETSNYGAGIAPWNIGHYKLNKIDENGCVFVFHKGKVIPTVFYHYQGITYENKNTANVNCYWTWGIDEKLVQAYYINYLKKVDEVKDYLRANYGFENLIKHHPGVIQSNKNSSIKKKLINLLTSICNPKKLVFSKIPKFIYKKKNYICI